MKAQSVLCVHINFVQRVERLGARRGTGRRRRLQTDAKSGSSSPKSSANRMADDPADALETPAERTHVRSRDISRLQRSASTPGAPSLDIKRVDGLRRLLCARTFIPLMGLFHRHVQRAPRRQARAHPRRVRRIPRSSCSRRSTSAATAARFRGVPAGAQPLLMGHLIILAASAAFAWQTAPAVSPTLSSNGHPPRCNVPRASRTIPSTSTAPLAECAASSNAPHAPRRPLPVPRSTAIRTFATHRFECGLVDRTPACIARATARSPADPPRTTQRSKYIATSYRTAISGSSRKSLLRPAAGAVPL